jgi:hypothetical protein
MFRVPLVRICSRISILLVLVAGLWLVSLRPTAKQAGTIVLPVSVQNLSSETDISPVTLRCENARLSAPNQIEKLSCVLKNNTDRRIVAGTIVLKVMVEQRGVIETISGYDSFDRLLHPDVHSEREPNFIPPQGEYVMDQLPTSYGEGIVKEISGSIDYVEFTNGPSVGPNVAGARIINDVRQGAAKYKTWLVREYHRNGMSAQAILQTLNKGDVVSQPDLDLQNSDQNTGANLFRKYLLRTYASKGEAELVKHIK